MIGWNAVEYEALGEDFHTRGKSFEEQIELLRMPWTLRSVTYQGKFHHVKGAGLAPLLRLRALLAHAQGDEVAYRNYRDRYGAMATSLRCEGYMKWAGEMT